MADYDRAVVLSILYGSGAISAGTRVNLTLTNFSLLVGIRLTLISISDRLKSAVTQPHPIN